MGRLYQRFDIQTRQNSVLTFSTHFYTFLNTKEYLMETKGEK